MMMMMMMMLSGDIDWFDSIDEEDGIEYPLICSTDNIWVPAGNKINA